MPYITIKRLLAIQRKHEREEKQLFEGLSNLRGKLAYTQRELQQANTVLEQWRERAVTAETQVRAGVNTISENGQRIAVLQREVQSWKDATVRLTDRVDRLTVDRDAWQRQAEDMERRWREATEDDEA